MRRTRQSTAASTDFGSDAVGPIGKLPFLVGLVAASFAIWLLTFSLVTIWSNWIRGDDVSSGDDDVNLLGLGSNLVELPNRLASTHLPLRLAGDACQDIDAYESSPHITEWRRQILRSNTATGDDVSGDGALRKVIVDSAFSKQHLPSQHTQLLCVVPVLAVDAERGKKAYEAWVRECDSAVFITNKGASDFPGIPAHLVLEVHPSNNDDKNNWQRFREAMKHLHRTPSLWNGVDFVLYAGDDSYVVVENLRRMMAEPYVSFLHRSGTPLYLGHRMVQGGTNAPFVSGSSYLFNKAALQIFVAVADHHNCDPNVNSESDDVLVAQCFRFHNIYPLQTSDIFGEDRVHMFDAAGVAAIVKDNNIAGWYPGYRKKRMPRGLDAFSRYSYHFHGMWAHTFDEYRSKIRRS